MQISSSIVPDMFGMESLNLIVESEIYFEEAQISFQLDGYKTSYGFNSSSKSSAPVQKCNFKIESLLVEEMLSKTRFHEKVFDVYTFVFEVSLLKDSVIFDKGTHAIQVKSPWENRMPTSVFGYKSPLHFEEVRAADVTPSFYVETTESIDFSQDFLDVSLHTDELVNAGNLSMELNETRYVLGPISVGEVKPNEPKICRVNFPANLQDLLMTELEEYMRSFPEIIMNFILEDEEGVKSKSVFPLYIPNPLNKELQEEKNRFLELLTEAINQLGQEVETLETVDFWSRFSVKNYSFQAGLKDPFYEITLELGEEIENLDFTSIEPEINDRNKDFSSEFALKSIDSYFILVSNMPKLEITADIIKTKIITMLEVIENEKLMKFVNAYVD